MTSESTRLVQSNPNFGSNGKRNIEEPLEISQGDMERRQAQEEPLCCVHGPGKSLVFGGYDGILASLAVISASAGAGLSWKITIVLSFSITIANALSMGISEFLSSKAHREFLQAEKRRELWEFKHYKDGEILEMVNRFEARGMARRDAELVVNKMAQYEAFFVGLMVAEELGLSVMASGGGNNSLMMHHGNNNAAGAAEEYIVADDDYSLLIDALVMFFSFASIGCLPICLFFLGFLGEEAMKEDDLFLVAFLFAMVLLSALGIIKSSFSSSSAWYSVLEAMILGGLCAGASYGIGALLMALLY